MARVRAPKHRPRMPQTAHMANVCANRVTPGTVANRVKVGIGTRNQSPVCLALVVHCVTAQRANAWPLPVLVLELHPLLVHREVDPLPLGGMCCTAWGEGWLVCSLVPLSCGSCEGPGTVTTVTTTTVTTKTGFLVYLMHPVTPITRVSTIRVITIHRPLRVAAVHQWNICPRPSCSHFQACPICPRCQPTKTKESRARVACTLET